ncbi:ATP-binding protein [Streptomyces sp. NBC_00038]|uniref:ATP-binding protein n=1 Tax=Streptomyces sp. NBC_00038 TaxID=2903615 RepID=UPI0022502770|nr:ATP-binding protein [Streptomyces sp. NBC_00038]MCX5559298.1 ATP-binding protein [Streptomyces sp. NBC_00038]
MADARDESGEAAAEPPPIGGMTLYPVPESVARARRWFRKFTAPYNLTCSIDDCVLMLSELVTNAILYGEAEEAWRVRVEWTRVGEALRVAVHNPGFPADVRLRSPDANDAHGRGLLLVDALADSWSAGPSRSGGTVVSFQVDQAWKPWDRPAK